MHPAWTCEAVEDPPQTSHCGLANPALPFQPQIPAVGEREAVGGGYVSLRGSSRFISPSVDSAGPHSLWWHQALSVQDPNLCNLSTPGSEEGGAAGV
jgi:hypothetical protein